MTKQEQIALIKFAKEMIRCVWEGGDADGAFIQDTAVELGLLKEVKFNPDEHEDHNGISEEGDPWYVFSGPLKTPTGAS